MGFRLAAAIAKNVGEDAMDEEPMIQRLVLGMCQDTNYQIRIEGAKFLKEYLQING